MNKIITEPLNSELPEDKVIREIFLIVNDCINKKVNPYKHALDEIEKLAKENVELLEGYHLEQAICLTILEIINQAKDGVEC